MQEFKKDIFNPAIIKAKLIILILAKELNDMILNRTHSPSWRIS